jgi:kynurenine formamidase
MTSIVLRLILPSLMLIGLRASAISDSGALPLAPAADPQKPATASSPSAPTAHLVDLGHPLRESDPTWEGDKVFTHTVTGRPGTSDIYLGKFSTDEHFGTHFDAPAHFGGAWTVDKVPVERLMRPAVRIDVAAKVQTAEDYLVTVDDVKAFERANGAIPQGAIVLLATGWDRYWEQPERYRNERNGVKHFPGLSREAAVYLVNERQVWGIAIDTMSVDYGPSTDYPVHHTTNPRNVFHVENAAGLTTLPPRGFSVIVAPTNIAEGSGAPTRIFALLP